MHDDPTTHAVTGNGDALRVNAEPLNVYRIAEIGEDGVGILEVLGKAEDSGAAPRAAIVEGDSVPACAADGLREIEKFLVSGQAVADDQSRMRARSGGLVDDAINLHAVGWDVEDGHLCGMRHVGGRIGEDGGRNGLGGGGDCGKNGENCKDVWAHDRTPEKESAYLPWSSRRPCSAASQQ